MENLNAENIKRGLECLNNKVDRDCDTCPIFWEARKSPITHNCRHIILDAALALLNSQEQRIKELTEENERLRADGRWISVKERLPATTLKTTTICDQDIGSGAIISETVVEAQVSEIVAVIDRRHIGGRFKEFLDYDKTVDGLWENNMGVTHWMPLPEVPESGQVCT